MRECGMTVDRGRWMHTYIESNIMRVNYGPTV